MARLSGKIAAVTGAGSGIGEAIARMFVAEGAQVFLLERDLAAGNRVAAELGEKARCIEADISDEQRVKESAKQLLDLTGGRIDILVNNAGIGHVGTVLTTTVADMDKMYRVNVLGTMVVTQAFLPTMIQQGRGSVVNVASIGGVVGIRDRFAYSTTKFAVVGMTRCMALDHALTGVRFNSICPGRVETPFVTARLKEYPDPTIARQQMAQSQAIGRMGTPEEIASCAVFLASDESSFMTGSELIVDGGLSAGK